ncbi:MAG: hypothetical protein KJO29_01170, partial [Bacteroidia bacterium]|nr:hypothetical protein [Bacteroidia bacterium]
MYKNLMKQFFLSTVIFLFTSSLIAQSAVDEKYYSSLEWREVGPWRGGRSCAVTGVPGSPNLFYFGSTGG